MKRSGSDPKNLSKCVLHRTGREEFAGTGTGPTEATEQLRRELAAKDQQLAQCAAHAPDGIRMSVRFLDVRNFINRRQRILGAHRLQSQLQRLSDESQDFQATCSRETANARFRFFCDGEEKIGQALCPLLLSGPEGLCSQRTESCKSGS